MTTPSTPLDHSDDFEDLKDLDLTLSNSPDQNIPPATTADLDVAWDSDNDTLNPDFDALEIDMVSDEMPQVEPELTAGFAAEVNLGDEDPTLGFDEPIVPFPLPEADLDNEDITESFENPISPMFLQGLLDEITVEVREDDIDKTSFFINPQQVQTAAPVQSPAAPASAGASPRRAMTLKGKVTALAIAIGVIPTLITGGLVSLVTSNQMRQDLLNKQAEKVQILSDSISRFMAERYGDIQVLATLPILNDPSGTTDISKASKTATLERYLKAYGVYNSIVFADLEGNVVLKTSASAPKSFKDVDYFKEAIRTQRPVINQPRRSTATGIYSLFLASPVFDIQSGALIGVVRTRVEAKQIDQLYLKGNQTFKDLNYWFVGKDKNVFITNQDQDLGKPADSILNALPDNLEKTKAEIESLKGIPSAVIYTQVQSLAGAGAIGSQVNLDWRLVVSQDTSRLFAVINEQFTLVLVSLGLTLVGIGGVAAYLSNRLTRPLLAASQAVQDIGRGNLSTRVVTTGSDELAQLGFNINRMAEKIQIAQMAEADAVHQRSLAQQAAVEQQAILAKQELAAQAEIAQKQAEFAEEQRQQKEALQMQLLELLSSIEGASRGDLTVRADVSANEIGVVADFFNSIIESLRQIVTQVQDSAQRVNQSVGRDETAMQQLSAAALEQAAEVNTTLDSIQIMTTSIQDVARNAQEAAQVARSASATALQGGQAMDSVVNNITGLQSTVNKAAEKVRQLGNASQEISKALNQINQIALQTDLLAINAEIEAARSGAAGQRFAVVAREVSALASRSAEATQEIEQIMTDIRNATLEVAEAMETSTAEVTVGSNLVTKTKARLEQILQVSEQIDKLVESISQATVSQSETSQVVAKLMKQVAISSEQTAESSRQVSEGLQLTAGITEELQASVRSFKLAEEN